MHVKSFLILDRQHPDCTADKLHDLWDRGWEIPAQGIFRTLAQKSREKSRTS